MLALMLTPAVLSLLVLAAHFLRRGQTVPSATVLGLLVTLVAVRRPWVPAATRWVLAAASLLWLWTLADLVRQRQAEGEPAARLGAILGSVAAVNVLAALLLGTRRVTGAYAARDTRPPAPN
jgi:hypothetical protein